MSVIEAPSEARVRQVLTGHKSLIVGIANDQSIAYGCAAAFRAAGADLAITWLNEKARPHVEPLARRSAPRSPLRSMSKTRESWRACSS